MRKFLLAVIISCCFHFAFCQTPEDALRSSWFIPNGTARSMSIGGAVGALGGDISSVYTNPAGIGMYKTSEAVVSPGMLFNSNQSDYRGTSLNGIKRSGFQLGTSGVVIGGKPETPNNSSAFSIAVTQVASYNNHIQYEGLNNYSSYSEQYLEELVRDNADLNAAANNYPFGSSLAFFTYLVDSLADPDGNLIGYRSLVPVPTGTKQQYDETDKGGLYEISFAYGANFSDKLYIGGGLNIPLSFYTQDINYTETDATEVINNNFSYSRFTQHHSIDGAGFNAKIGAIYRPTPSVRLGFAFHTPSFLYLSDDLSAEMTTDTEDYAGSKTAKSSDFPNAVSHAHYTQLTPYRLIGSLVYILNQVEDVKKQKGFVSADIEFANHRGSRYWATYQGEDIPQSVDDYYRAIDDVIKSYYQGAVNFRLGGELKFSPIAIRLGGAYYSSPYADHSLKASRAMLGGGLGYRDRGMFVDLTFVETFNTDVSFPYRLADKANTFAELKNQRANVLLTFGIKF